MEAAATSRAIAAARSTAAALDLEVDDVVVLRDANRVVVRLLPCDVVARVAPVAYRASAELEVEIARRLAEVVGAPVVALHPRVAPRAQVCDAFVMNMWTFHEPVAPEAVRPASYAEALQRLHAGMAQIDLPTPHFTDQVADARRVVDSAEESPALRDVDRDLVSTVLHRLERSIVERGAVEQLVHGDPHSGNLLGTPHDPLFIDLEDCCRGPVELDVARVPLAVAERYGDADRGLVGECRGLALAMVAAWRWRRGDRDPGGRAAGHALLHALREGPPWPSLDVIGRRLASP